MVKQEDIMWKKKITYVEKLILLTIIICSLFTISSLLLIIVIGNISRLPMIVKVLLSFTLLLLPTLFIALIRRKAIIPLRQYKLITEKFLQGHIYMDFIEQASKIYPGMDKFLNHIDKLINSKQLDMETNKRSEFIALQNQINPHFLYNTLEAIRGDALSEGVEYIADITEALSTFFRYSVTDTGSLVTISDELENVDNYFKIQQYRFGEKLELVYEIPEDEDILELMCPKLTLQPIVENAIFHGLEKRADKGSIKIRLKLTNHKLTIIVNDNGVGMDDETLDTLNYRLKQNTIANTQGQDKSKKGGIALINVSRRIKLLFGENFGIQVFSIPEIGTDVYVTIPIVKNDME